MTHDKLRELAQSATQGPWEVEPYLDYEDPVITGGPDGIYVCQTSYDNLSGTCEHDRHADAAFIAAANPSTVLSLLDEIAALKAENERLRKAADEAVYWIGKGLNEDVSHYELEMTVREQVYSLRAALKEPTP